MLTGCLLLVVSVTDPEAMMCHQCFERQRTDIGPHVVAPAGPLRILPSEPAPPQKTASACNSAFIVLTTMLTLIIV